MRARVGVRGRGVRARARARARARVRVRVRVRVQSRVKGLVPEDREGHREPLGQQELVLVILDDDRDGGLAEREHAWGRVRVRARVRVRVRVTADWRSESMQKTILIMMKTSTHSVSPG